MPALVTALKKHAQKLITLPKNHGVKKGTGRARSGMTSSPLWRKGGRAFPNKPDENFTQKVNRKMYRAGMATILSQLVRDERLFVIESCLLQHPKPKNLLNK